MRMLKSLIALMLLAASQAAGAATIESCDSDEYGWITDFTFGILDESNATFEEAWAASTGRDFALVATGNLLEDAAINAGEYYRDTLRLKPPPRLQCLTDDDGPSPRIIYIVDAEYDGSGTLGEYYSPNWRQSFTSNSGPKVPDIRISPEVVRAFESMANHGRAKSAEFLTLAHELFHAIESAYPLFVTQGEGLKLRTRKWVDEGLSDAFAHAWLKHYEKQNPAYQTTFKRDLPQLDDPLHLPEDEDEAYERSYFWSFLASEKDYVYSWRDKEGAKGQLIPMPPKSRFDPRLLIRYMNMAGNSVDVSNTSSRYGQWELAWLDEMLKNEFNKAIQAIGVQVPRPLEGGVFVAYPNYAAWLLGHVTTNVSTAERNSALGEMFNKGCIGKTLTAGTDATTGVRINDLSTRCLLVTRSAGYENDQVDVTAKGSAAELESVHLLWNGGVVVPHRDDGQAKTWRVGLPQGTSKSNPTGPQLILGLANAPEDISAMVAKSETQAPGNVFVDLVIKFAAAGN